MMNLLATLFVLASCAGVWRVSNRVCLSERFGAAALCVDRAIVDCQNSQPRLVDRRFSGAQSDVRAELHLYLDKTLRRLLRPDGAGSISFRLAQKRFATNGRGICVPGDRTAGSLFGSAAGAVLGSALLVRPVPPSRISLAGTLRLRGSQRSRYYVLGWDGRFTNTAGKIPSAPIPPSPVRRNYSLVGNLRKIVENTFKTVVPFPLRGRYENDASYDPHYLTRGLAFLRDWLFCIYQTSFPAMLGLGV